MSKYYYELFSNKGDKRPGLFFTVIKEIYIKEISYPKFINQVIDGKKIFSGTEIPLQMHNVHYGTNEDTRCSNESINKEWVDFFVDMYLYLINISSKNDDSNILKLIKELGKTNIPVKSELQLVKNLFFALYEPIDSKGNLITITKELTNTTTYNIKFSNSLEFINILFNLPQSYTRSTSSCITSFLDLGYDIFGKLNRRVLPPASGFTTFSFKKSEFIAKIIFNKKDEDDKKDFFDEETNKYSREGNYFATYDDNGTQIIYNREELTKKYEEIGCKAIGLDSKNCTDYISKCLEGSNIEECADYFKEEMNFLQVREEIEKLHPEVILNTIKGLHLPKEKVQVSFSKSKIYILQEYSEWLCFIKDTLPVDDYKKIKDNQKLKKYVKTLISFVNANPVLLNPNFIDNRITKQITIPANFLKSGKLAQYGIEPNHSVANGHHGLILSRNIGEFSRLMHDYHQRMFLDLGIATTPVQRIIGMAGGAVNKYEEMQTNPMKRTYTMFFDYYTGLVKSLEVVGKQIDQKDSERIVGYLQKLKKSEEAVLKAVNVVGNYIKLYNIFGEDNDESPLSLNKMNELVEERKTKVTGLTNKHNSLLSVFETLAKVVDDNLDPKVVLKMESL